VALGSLVGKLNLEDVIEVRSDYSSVCLDNVRKAERCKLLHGIHGVHEVWECLCKCKDVVETGCVDCSSSVDQGRSLEILAVITRINA